MFKWLFGPKRHPKIVIGYRDKSGERKDFDEPLSIWQAISKRSA